jgi:hypothetical protein
MGGRNGTRRSKPVKAKTLVGLTAMLAAFVVLMVGDWSSGRAQPVASITLPSPGVTKQLYPGCNNIGLTFPNGTSSGDVIAAVSPAGSVEAMWRHDAAQQRWEAFSAAAPSASDLLTVNFLDAIWMCIVGGPPTATPATPAGQSVTPASTATATAQAGQTATPTPNAATATASAGRTATPRPTGPTATPGTVSTAVSPIGVLTSFRYTMEWTTGTGADAVTVSSEGAFKAPGRIRCDLSMSGGGMSFTWERVVVIPPDAWIDTGSGWTHTTPSDPTWPAIVGDLTQLCPGYGPFWEGFLPLGDLGSIEQHSDPSKGVPAVRLSLKGRVESIPSIPVLPTSLEGADVQTFDIWVAQDGGWLVALEFDATFGDVPTRIQVDVTNPNDPTIEVNRD